MAREHEPLSLIFCDVDHFKEYNDRYGHQAGDGCLKLTFRTSISSISKLHGQEIQNENLNNQGSVK
jgi:diguanylate cyclase (GGDEF)-like protein